MTTGVVRKVTVRDLLDWWHQRPRRTQFVSVADLERVRRRRREWFFGLIGPRRPDLYRISAATTSEDEWFKQDKRAAR